MEDAASRYREASMANDIDGIMALLSPDAELVSPLSGKMVFRGSEDLRALLSAIYGLLRDLRWDEPVGDGSVRVLIGGGRVGPLWLGDAMVFELAPDGRIARIRPHLRPWLSLTLLALLLAPRVPPGVALRALRSR